MAASTSRGRAPERASAAAGTASARARGSASRRRPSAWAVAAAILASAARGAEADLTATRPLEGPAVARPREVLRVTAPRVAPRMPAAASSGRVLPSEEGAQTPLRALEGNPNGNGGHSPAFLQWAARHDKLGEYCPGSAPPCEESLHREAVWRVNAAAIEAHNKQGGSLMKKGLTRFADLTTEEFTAAHATYAGGTPVPAVSIESSHSSSFSASAKEASNKLLSSRTPRRAGDGGAARESAGDASGTASSVISLKLATDEAAARGDALPSEEEDEDADDFSLDSSEVRFAADDADAALVAQATSSPFPALGASAGLSKEERRAAARERRRAARVAAREAHMDVSSLGFPGEAAKDASAARPTSGPLGSGLPDHFDWSDHVDFGEVVHQGACAGCWAYSTAAVVEAARFVADGTRARMSPYSLIDCDDLDRGCATGNMASAYAWIQTSEYGLPPLKRYPRMSKNGKCDVNAGLGAALGAFSVDGKESEGAFSSNDEYDDDDEKDARDEEDAVSEEAEASSSSGNANRRRSSLGVSGGSSLFGGGISRVRGKTKQGVSVRKDGTPIHIPTGNARTTGYCDLPVLHRDAEAQLLRALAQQPVAVGVNIHALQFYESGIVHMADCPPAASDPLKAINHAAVITGWGRDEKSGQYYWILRNTYGDRWGENGYARLAFGRDPETGFGACALYTEGNYPLVGDLTCTPGATRKEAVRHGAHVWLYPGGYNMGPRDAGAFGGDGVGLSYAAAAVSEQMARFSLGLGEEARAGAVGVASVLVLAAAVTIALQASTLARLRREAARGSPEERARLTSPSSGENGKTPKSAFTDDVLEG